MSHPKLMLDREENVNNLFLGYVFYMSTSL